MHNVDYFGLKIHFTFNKEIWTEKYLVSSIPVASGKTVQRGRVAPQVTSIPTNLGNWKSSHHANKFLSNELQIEAKMP